MLTQVGAPIAAGASVSAKSNAPWWQHAVFYEIYPRSFKDSNGDGIGDINGITSKLDYLHDLGIDAIWLTPCYPSPQVDFGYDIADYCAIAPEYGTMADFDRLVAEAKKRNIKIVMDFVVNHTSDKHPWFLASASSKTDPKRDWYIWRDGKNGGPPNNWQSLFGHSAWKLDPKTNQYYYHFFYAEQPDLNWRNPELRKAMMEVAKFWLKRGVAGFRLDAVGCLFEDTELHDNPVLPGTNAYGDPNTEYKYNDQYPEVHDIMRELRSVLDAFPGADHPVLIGETAGPDVKKISSMYGANLDEIQLPMNFFFAYANKRSAVDFRKLVGEWDANPAKGWPLYFFSNHDQIRHYVRYGNGTNNDAIAKLMAAMLLTIRGTPLMYYGEELGMENNDPKRVEDVFDPIGKIGWPKEKGRDGERTPMQWTAGEHAGFSTAKPWLNPPASFTSHNVEAESKEPNSLLNVYKKLIAMRTKEPFKTGSYEPINTKDENVFAYLRKEGSSKAVVVLNFSDKKQTFKPEIGGADFGAAEKNVLLKEGVAEATGGSVVLEPFGVYIAELK
ncbi:MAG: alpha-glucosidase [Cyanobacteria bacterium REEB67]|nr:alpha-glucosidase [Cyanobacteria bacterium REEB67]